MPEPQKIADYLIGIVQITRNLSPAWRAKAVSYFYLPLIILSLVGYYGGGLSTSSDIVVSELKTELAGGADPSSKRGLVVIADPTSLTPSEYIIPLAPNGAKVWSSLDEQAAGRNKEKVGIEQDELNIKTPFIGATSGPVTLVVEGDLGKEIYAHGETVPVAKWGISSRRSDSVLYGVLIACALALGLGAAVGFPPVKPDEDNASQEGKEPDKI